MNPLMAVVDAVIIVEMVRHNLICLRIYDPFQRPAVRPGVSDVDEHRILFPAAQVDKFLLNKIAARWPAKAMAQFFFTL